jgi:hypothetical protein
VNVHIWPKHVGDNQRIYTEIVLTEINVFYIHFNICFVGGRREDRSFRTDGSRIVYYFVPRTPVYQKYTGRLPVFITTAQILQPQTRQFCCAVSLANNISISLLK